MKYLCFFVFLLSGLGTFSQIPDGYYDDAEGKSGEELKSALNAIIDRHTEYPYTSSSTDTWDILKEADKDPNNAFNVLCIYSGFSRDAKAEYSNGSGWSREHVWPQSRGNFGTERGAGTDAHHLRAADVSTNSARSNRNFAYECPNQYVDGDGPTQSHTCTSEFSWEPPDQMKGDIARILFYMATRYEGKRGEPDLELTDILQDRTSKEPLHGKLNVLLKWHEEDPVSLTEKERNDIIYGYQNNRNPFIDHPEYVNEIVWENDSPVLSTQNKISDIWIYPNPAAQELIVQIPIEASHIAMYDLQGNRLFNDRVTELKRTYDISKLVAGQYIVEVYFNSQRSVQQKFVVED